MRPVVEVVGGLTLWHIGRCREHPRARRGGHRLLEVFLDVGPDVEYSTPDKHPSGVGKEHVREHAAFAVTGLPPRIGEVDMDRVETGVGKEVPDEDVAVAGDDPGVAGCFAGPPAA
jgi:hypothetical protein